MAPFANYDHDEMNKNHVEETSKTNRQLLDRKNGRELGSCPLKKMEID